MTRMGKHDATRTGAGNERPNEPQQLDGDGMKLKYRLFLAIFLVGVILASILTLWNHLNDRERSVQTSLDLLQREAAHHGEHLELALKGMARVVRTLGHSPLIIHTLASSNADFERMDETAMAEHIRSLNTRWRAAADATDPLVRERLGNPVALYLKTHQQANPGEYGEIFVTNRQGAMIASTGKLTTLAHAHKYWWQAGWHGGTGRIFFDDRGFDASVSGYVLGVVAPLFDGERFVGMIKANFNILHILKRIVESPESQEGHAQILARSGGRIVLEAGRPPLSTDLPSGIRERLVARKAGSMLLQDSSLFVGHAPIAITLGDDRYGFGGKGKSIDHIMGNEGETWVLLVTEREEVALAEMRRDMWTLVGFGGLLIVALAAVALWIGHLLTRPFDHLVAHAQRIGGGDLHTRLDPPSSTLEFSHLAEAFNRMIDNLRQTTTSRDELARDVEERKRAEQQVHDFASRMEAANQELQNFSYVASHDLQEPLRTMNNYAEFLKEDLKEACLDDAVREDLRFITGAAARMQTLVQDLLAYSRSGRLEVEGKPVSLNDAMEAARENLRTVIEESGARIAVGDLPRVQGNGAALTSVLQNLLGNAVKFHRPGVAPEIEISAEPEGDRWRIRITDNGIGMEEKYLERIFQPFNRLHGKKAYPGSGLGLAIARKIIEKHGGVIRAESTLDQGSSFILTLPGWVDDNGRPGDDSVNPGKNGS